MTGRCLCGSVRFQIRGALAQTGFCHCTSCQRASGSAFAVNAPVAQGDVTWSAGRESIAEYESSPGKFRAFCRGCGSPIYARLVAEPGSLSIRLGLIEGDPGTRPDAHWNVADRAAWYAILDDLPQHTGDTEDT